MLLSFQLMYAYDFEADGIYYDVKSFTDLTVTAVSLSEGVEGSVVIPQTVEFNGKTLHVTNLGDSFAKGNSNIKSVTINAEIKAISMNAFADCVELESVIVPHVAEIGDCAFLRCESLTEVILSDGISKISSGAFSFCSSLQSLSIPLTLKVLGESAFRGCIKINNLDIRGVVDIPSSVFEDCYALTNIKISDELNSIGSKAFKGTHFTKFEIPNSVTNVGGYVFSGCDSLESVIIGNGVSVLSSPLFENCPNLTELIIKDGESPLSFSYISGDAKYTSPHNPNSYSVNAYSCFEGLNLQTVYIGRSLKCGTVGYKTYSVPFLGNETIEKITIGPKVKSIPLAGMSSSGGDISESTWSQYKVGFFQGCSNLKEVIILGGGIKALSNQLFENCINLSTITLGYGVSYIGDDALSNCEALSNIIFYAEQAPLYSGTFSNSQYINCKLSIPVSSEGSYKSTSPWENFWNIEENPDLVAFFVVDDIEYEVVQNNEVQIIGTSFKEPSDITLKSVVSYKNREYSLVDIADNAFTGNKDVLSISLPTSIDVIKDNQFKDCVNLTQVYLPTSLTIIGNSAFENCSSLSEMNIPRTLTKFGNSCFKGCVSLASIDLSECNIRSIPNKVFYDCKQLLSIVLPMSIEEIFDQAFYNCESLSSIELNSIETIGSEAFFHCASIEKIEIPSDCKSIGNGAFSKMQNLKDVVFDVGEEAIIIGHNNDLTLSNSITPFPNPNNVDERRTGFRNGYYDGLFYGLPIEHLVINRDIELPKYYERTIGNSTSSYSTVYNDIIYYPPFYGLNNLKYVEIGENVSAVCKNQIEAVVNAIPTTMEYTNFGKCDNIEVVVSNNPDAPIGVVFSQPTYENATLFLPNGDEESYRNDEYWKRFAHIMDSPYIETKSIDFGNDEIVIDLNESKTLLPNINPDNASIKKLKWISSKPSIVSVSEEGVITSYSREGECTITAMACDGSGVSAATKIIVQAGASVSDVLVDVKYGISVESGSIIIEGKAEGDIVEIFNLQGQRITSSSNSVIDLKTKGVFVIRIGSNNRKIVL